jgi:hypothetical protein
LVRSEQAASYHRSSPPEVLARPVSWSVLVHRLVASHAGAEIGTAIFVSVLRVVFIAPGAIAKYLLFSVVARLDNLFMLVSRGSFLWCIAFHVFFFISL